ncbi:putative odorant receptor 69a [Drosophila ficusphila]|uniref:putative odorant receptor 69a n=1 Tax=Drosophila ficusphila TaxID=30025 RepID=UPI0007E691FB|nr:putative odorant receptor 69a [Drosophila ficusphila]
MQFHSYTKYIDRACFMACIPRYQWSGRPTERKPYSLEKKTMFVLGVICSIYQIFGVFMYWYRYGRLATDTVTFVTEISEMCGSLMLTLVGSSNIYALTKHRRRIERIFEDLQELYPRENDKHYRNQYYYDKAMRIMKIEFILYMVFYVYYNSAPILLLLWENLQDEEELSFRTQTNTWFPWKVHGSAIGFGVAVISIAMASFVGVGFSLATHDLVCIFTCQLKMHYDGMANKLLHLDSSQPGAVQQLKQLIAYHYRILQIGDHVNYILNFIFGSSLVGSTIAICMTSVAVLLLDFASALKYISGLVAFLLYNFIMCYMGTEVTTACRMQLQDYLKYMDISCWLGFTARFQWIGGRMEGDPQSLARRISFFLAAGSMLYQNFGIITYWYMFGLTEKDAIKFVAELAETCGSLMLTLIAITNIWTMTRNRLRVEEAFAEIQAMSPRSEDNQYRRQHYYDTAMITMKWMFRFYAVFYFYYNGEPLLLLLWQYSIKKDISYSMQANTWFPWRVQGSGIGFGIAYLSEALGSFLGVCYTLIVLNALCIFTCQLRFHFDALTTQLLSLDCRSPGSKQKLRNLIAYHCRILRLGEQFNQILNPIFLSSVVFSTIALCMSSLAVLLLDLASAMKYINGIIAFIFYNFYISYLGTQITIESFKILPAAFYSNWYEGDPAYRKMILILMIRASKPYMWKTYNLSSVSITTYMDTLKFSYQMFTCMRSLK